MSNWQTFTRKSASIEASAYQPGDDLAGVPFSYETQAGAGDWLWRWPADPAGVTRIMSAKWFHDHFRPA